MRVWRLVPIAMMVTPLLSYGATEPPRVSSRAGIAYAAASGNTENTTLGLNASLTVRLKPYTLSISGGHLRSSYNHTRTAEQVDAAVRGERTIRAPLSAYLQGIYYRDPFAGVLRQYSADGGITWHVLKRTKISLEVAQGVAPTWERRRGTSEHHFIGTSTSSQVIAQLTKSFQFQWQGAYTHDFSDGRNWRWSSSADISLALYRRILSLQCSRSDRLRGRPDPGKRSRDSYMTLGLVFQFPGT